LDTDEEEPGIAEKWRAPHLCCLPKSNDGSLPLCHKSQVRVNSANCGQEALQYPNRCPPVRAVLWGSHGHRFCGSAAPVPVRQRSEVVYSCWGDCGYVVDEKCRRVG